MAQPSQSVPTVTMNVNGNRQQANLRDYLNVRVAPFLKKSIHESLSAEPEYPLQWLGEHLIQQSILFEGNPDSKNIRERFLYNHDVTETKPVAAESSTSQDHTPPASQSQVAQSSLVNDGMPDATSSAVGSVQQHAQTNGTSPSQASQELSKDTEMSGTS